MTTMTPEMIETARRLVEQEWWQTEPDEPVRWDEPGEAKNGLGGRGVETGARYVLWNGRCIPDLTDPATGGVLLGMAVEHGTAEVFTGANGTDLRLWGHGYGKLYKAATLAHAAALALLAVRRAA